LPEAAVADQVVGAGGEVDLVVALGDAAATVAVGPVEVAEVRDALLLELGVRGADALDGLGALPPVLTLVRWGVFGRSKNFVFLTALTPRKRRPSRFISARFSLTRRLTEAPTS